MGTLWALFSADWLPVPTPMRTSPPSWGGSSGTQQKALHKGTHLFAAGSAPGTGSHRRAVDQRAEASRASPRAPDFTLHFEKKTGERDRFQSLSIWNASDTRCPALLIKNITGPSVMGTASFEHLQRELVRRREASMASMRRLCSPPRGSMNK